jgi:glyoxalase family protein
MLQGLHHVAVVSKDVARATDFYARVLGLRELGNGPAPLAPREAAGEMVGGPARYFSDGAARAGGLLAVIDQPDASAGATGIGGTHHFALCVEDRETLLMWKRRLLDEGYGVDGILDRHYFQSIYVKGPDGTIVELATRGPGWTIDEPPDRIGEEHRPPPSEMLNTNRDRARIAGENWSVPVPEITTRMRLQGLHHVTAIGESIERTHTFLTEQVGMRRVKRTNNFDDAASFHWYWGVGDGRPGSLVTYFERSRSRERAARMGAGQVAHYAVGAEPGAIEPLREALTEAGLPVSPVAEFGPDGARFQAVATRDPDGQHVIVASRRARPS